MSIFDDMDDGALDGILHTTYAASSPIRTSASSQQADNQIATPRHVPTSIKQVAGRTGFFDLPGEVRNDIYERMVHRTWDGRVTVRNRALAPRGDALRQASIRQACWNGLAYPSKVCKQFRHELLSIWGAHQTLELPLKQRKLWPPFWDISNHFLGAVLQDELGKLSGLTHQDLGWAGYIRTIELECEYRVHTRTRTGDGSLVDFYSMVDKIDGDSIAQTVGFAAATPAKLKLEMLFRCCGCCETHLGHGFSRSRHDVRVDDVCPGHHPQALLLKYVIEDFEILSYK